MKRTLMLLLLAGTVQASESFVLDIPIRFNANQETGKEELVPIDRKTSDSERAKYGVAPLPELLKPISRAGT